MMEYQFKICRKRCYESRFILLVILHFMLPVPVHGQGEPQGTSLISGISSPTPASLGRYGDIPVSLFTGTPAINVPLFELEGRSLSMPIELNYHGSGVRVEELAGWAGLGWSLDAGGVITRTVRGLTDDQLYGYLLAGGDSAEVNLDPFNTPSQEYLEMVHQGMLDGEPDQYFFNFAGRSGQIFLERDEGATPYKYRTLTMPQQDIRIEMQRSGSSISGWIITTEDGTRYSFDHIETTQIITMQKSEWYTSSWYLTKVESASGNDVIELTYQEEGPVSVIQRSEEWFDTLINGSSECTPESYYQETTTHTQKVQYLWKIETAQHRAIFNREARTDGGGERLASIDIEHNTTSDPVRRYELDHGYFNAGASELHQRLRLDGVRQFEGAVTAPEELPSWDFVYNTSYDLPPRDSKSMDHWGFFNDRPNSVLYPEVFYNGTWYVGADREPSEPHSLAGVLEEITYPTGGRTTFTYEGHQYYNQTESSNLPGGGVRIKRVEHHDGMSPANSVVLEYRYTKSSDPSQSSGVLLRNPKEFHIHNFDAWPYNCHYMSRASTSYIAPGMMNGSVIMYSEVTVLRGSNGEDGRTLTTFKIPNTTSNFDWPYTPTVVESWRGGGNVTSSKELNASGQTQSQTDHTYSFSNSHENIIRGVVVAARPRPDFSPTPYEYIPNIYLVNNGFSVPASETRHIFNDEGTASMSHSISYTYGNLPDLVQMTRMTETNSDNTQRITEYNYAHEVAEFNAMRSLNMLSQPWSVTIRDAGENVLQKNWTVWDDNDGFWRPRCDIVWDGIKDLNSYSPTTCN